MYILIKNIILINQNIQLNKLPIFQFVNEPTIKQLLIQNQNKQNTGKRRQVRRLLNKNIINSILYFINCNYIIYVRI